MSNAACADVSLILLDDASRFTIARSEVYAGSALVAAVRSFHTSMEEQMMQGPILSVHMITRCDKQQHNPKEKIDGLDPEFSFCHFADFAGLESGRPW